MGKTVEGYENRTYIRICILAVSLPMTMLTTYAKKIM